MQTVARQEAQLERLARDRQEDAARHSSHVKEIYARMQREQEEALEAAAKEAEYAKNKALHLLQVRKRAQHIPQKSPRYPNIPKRALADSIPPTQYPFGALLQLERALLIAAAPAAARGGAQAKPQTLNPKP
jgi:hypothetical protein